MGIVPDEYCFAIGIEVGPAGTPCHLVVFPHRDRDHPLPAGIPAVIPDDHAAGRKVEACSQGRRGRDAADMTFPETLLDNGACFPPESGMVECRPAPYAQGKRFLLVCLCDPLELLLVRRELLFVQFECFSRTFCIRFGVLPR